MGFISDLAEGKVKDFPGQNRGRETWNNIFGNLVIPKEGGMFPAVRPVPGGSFGRTGIASPESFKRLLQAMRSMAPGGWPDDRFEQTKHWSDIRYICGHRIGEQLLQSKSELFEKTGPGDDDKRQVMPSDPPHAGRLVRPYRLMELLQEPNEEDSLGDILYEVVMQLFLTGEHLLWGIPSAIDAHHPKKKYQGCGAPAELYTVPTAIAIPQPAINPDYPDGYYRIQPLYPYGPFSSYPTPATAVGAPIPAQWIFKTKYKHPLLRYAGNSPQTALRLVLDEIEQMDRSRWYILKRMINPSAKLTSDNKDGNAQPLPESEIERIVAEMENEHTGPENAGKLFIPPPGWNLETMDSNLRDLQYREGWEQLVSFAMAAFGISKEAAGMIGSTAYAQLWAALKQLSVLTLNPLCVRISNRWTRCLCPFFGDNLFLEIKPPKINDEELNFQKADKGTVAKCVTKDEVRKWLDLEPSSEEWGKEMAGDPSEAEKEQQQQEQKAMMQAEEAGGPEQKEAPEIAKERPGTGTLGEGSLGPKSKHLLNGRHGKSLYSQMRKALTNGHTRS